MAASPALFPAAPLPALVGFSGARRLSPVFRPQVAQVVARCWRLAARSRSVAPERADAFVRCRRARSLVFPPPPLVSGRPLSPGVPPP
ncbi:MAG: hypothetical protein IPL59_15010 [Candidatus Competibacteraceae bacterium]|nr:hypothetical protein [Candidatus Competibacteraceae bacterium]